MRANSFKPYNAEGKQLDLLSIMTGKDSGELNAFVRKERGENAGKLIPVRICFKKKDKDALDSTRKKMKRKESKKQTTISESTYAFNEYIVLCTSLDRTITAEEVIELYRYTNNTAERAIRCARVKEKVSGCFRTKSGADDFACVLSFISSAALHGVSSFDAIVAAFRGNAVGALFGVD